LPTIGKKSALRLAYHIVMNDNYCGIKIAHSIENALKNITKCSRCGSMSEHEICEFCLDESRDNTKLCIVQSAKDIFVIEDSKQFDGKYFVIEELDQDLIDSLHKFIDNNEVENILFAITPSIANDAFILYIEDKLKDLILSLQKLLKVFQQGLV
jgi:recombination protein RecR